MNRIQRIIWCEEEAERHLSSAEELQYEAARLISEELATGKTQDALGKAIGKHRSHVGFMARAHELANGYLGSERPAFNSLYQQAKEGITEEEAAEKERQREALRVEATRLYVDERLGQEKVAKRMDIPRGTVRKLLDEAGVQPRLTGSGRDTGTPPPPARRRPDTPPSGARRNTCADRPYDTTGHGLTLLASGWKAVMNGRRQLRSSREDFNRVQAALDKMQLQLTELRIEETSNGPTA